MSIKLRRHRSPRLHHLAHCPTSQSNDRHLQRTNQHQNSSLRSRTLCSIRHRHSSQIRHLNHNYHRSCNLNHSYSHRHHRSYSHNLHRNHNLRILRRNHRIQDHLDRHCLGQDHLMISLQRSGMTESAIRTKMSQILCQYQSPLAGSQCRVSPVTLRCRI